MNFFKELTGYDETPERVEAWNRGRVDGSKGVFDCPYGADTAFELTHNICYKKGYWCAEQQRARDAKMYLEALQSTMNRAEQEKGKWVMREDGGIINPDGEWVANTGMYQRKDAQKMVDTLNASLKAAEQENLECEKIIDSVIENTVNAYPPKTKSDQEFIPSFINAVTGILNLAKTGIAKRRG